MIERRRGGCSRFPGCPRAGGPGRAICFKRQRRATRKRPELDVADGARITTGRRSPGEQPKVTHLMMQVHQETAFDWVQAFSVVPPGRRAMKRKEDP